MEKLNFPEGEFPQDGPQRLPMDRYLEFVMMNRKLFPPDPKYNTAGDMPAPVRFVIREEDERYFRPPDKA